MSSINPSTRIFADGLTFKGVGDNSDNVGFASESTLTLTDDDDDLLESYTVTVIRNIDSVDSSSNILGLSAYLKFECVK